MNCAFRARAAFCALGFWLAWHAPTAAQRADGQAAPTPTAAPIDYATAHDSRRLEVARARGAIRLDGVLDDEPWVDAPMAHDFIQNDPREGMPATYDTEVRVVYDDDALYFGVFAKDDQPGRIIVSDLKKDYNVDTSDGFRVVLDTFRDGRNGYVFAINPAGARWDAQMANEGRESNANWDGIWDVATRITETGWYAEIRIPYQTIRFSGEMPTWGINFQRKIRRLNEDSYWSPIPRIWDLDRVSLAGTLEGTRGLRPGKDLRVKPYALSSSNTVAGRGTAGDFDAGLDVKYGVTTGLTLDLTVNTDFSQVEADEQQINLSRFSLFFPEKRDFFLENSGIFQFGGAVQGGGIGSNAGRQNGAQDMRLFFSRRIGLSDTGSAIPILAGTRLTGRQGAYSVGVLNVQQREVETVPATNFTALRVRRDILANSDIGAMVLARQETGVRVQPGGRRRRELPVRLPDLERLRREVVFAAGGDAGLGARLRYQGQRRLRGPRLAGSCPARHHRPALRRRDGLRPPPRRPRRADLREPGLSTRGRSRSWCVRYARTGRWTCSRDSRTARWNRVTRTGTCP